MKITPVAAGRAFCRVGLLLAALVLLAGCEDGDAGVSVTGEFPVAWVERAFPRDAAGNRLGDNLREPGEFRPGARLMLKRRAAPAAPAIDLAARLFAAGERYDVRDVSASRDGRKLLFALRGPFLENVRDEDQPTWNIWEYDIAANSLRRVIASDLVAEEGHDIMPAYLADGRIVFSSTRQRASRAVLVDEGKPQYAMLDDTRQNEAFLLHVMNADGSSIRQISFNGAHDLYPSLLADGRVLFARQVRTGGAVRMHLYTVLPDGRELSPAFGGASHDTVDNVRVEFARPVQLDDGRILVLERPFETDNYGGALSIIDLSNYSDENQRLDTVAGLGGIEAVDLPAYPGERIAPRAGRYADAVPLGDDSGRLLVSWSACRLEPVAAPPAGVSRETLPCAGNDVNDPALREAPPIYGVFVLDPATGTRLPVVVPREGMLYEHVAVAAPRPEQDQAEDGRVGFELDRDLYEEGAGVLDIRSVYDLDGAFFPWGSNFPGIAELADPLASRAVQRPVRWLRLEKIVAIPSREVRDFRQSAFGVNGGNGMREILGYVPVEPDGSVRVKVPANVPLTFSLVDDRGRRIHARHTAWVQVVPGEVRVCAGCHDGTSRLPHGRNDSGVLPLYAGADGGAPFPNTLPALEAGPGETMAQLRTREDIDALAPAMDLLYTDAWTDPALRTPDADSALRYADLATLQPASADCQAAWRPFCRSTIHYETHIHPLWSVDRRVFEADGTTLREDRTCTSCHTPRDENGNLRLTATGELLSQLNLGDGFSGEVPERFNAYQELFAQDNRQVDDAGSIVDQLVQQTDADGNPVFELDADGFPRLDDDGMPIPVLVPVIVPSTMVAGGALASRRFFVNFNNGERHAGWLTPAELRLLSEWTDIGAQYFNDPFVAPLD